MESVLYGPELDSAPVASAIAELGHALRSAGACGGISLELMYVVPGSLGAPDFDGSEVAVASASHQRLRLIVAVSRRVAQQAAPLDALVQLAAGAIREAARTVDWFKGTEECIDSLASAAAEVVEDLAGGGQQVQAPAQDWVRIVDQVESELGLSRHQLDVPSPANGLPPGAKQWEIEAHIPLPSDARIAALEDSLVGAIEADGTTTVDGNEVGGSELVTFMSSTDPTATERAIVAAMPLSTKGALLLVRSPEGDVRRIVI